MNTPPVRSDTPRWSGSSLGHYDVGKLIGAGGMGEVYEAEDTRLGRKVALKVLPREVARDRERLARFSQEARTLAALSHPGIVTIYSVDQSDGEHFLTMELVQGRTLKACIPPQGLAAEPLLDLAIPLAEALGAAHGRGIVHRDLKPANVMLTTEGRIKVLDFGLAKLVETPRDSDVTMTVNQTVAGAVVGTLAYMAPEQLAGKPADARSDVFSLGVMLYEMAAGVHPFAGPTPAAMMLALMQETPASLLGRRPGLPQDLDRLIADCLEKEPDRRPVSAAEVAAGLQAIRQALHGSRVADPAHATTVVPSVAVLPFADMSPTHDQEYFCDGIAEEIINALTQLEGLRVTARTSSFAFKGKLEDVREIGGRLGVGAVLEGSVRKAGERLRITVQLINVADGYHLWSERFDRRADDIFAIQDEISLGVVEKLKVKLLAGEAGMLFRRREPTQEAYHLYLKGRYFLNRRRTGDLKLAIGHFEQAIVADPGYGDPHVGIAGTFFVLGLWDYVPSHEAFGRARRELEQALALDDSLGEAHILLASILALREWDWDGANRHFEHARKLRAAGGFSGLGMGFYHLVAGRVAEALKEARAFAEREPLSAIIQTQAGASHLGAGDVDGAVRFLEKALELDPGMPMALLWLGVCRGVEGRLEEAEKLLRASIQAGLPAAQMFLPEALARVGRIEEARTVVRALDESAGQRYVSPLTLALAHASIGEKDRSLTFLEQAEREHSAMFALSIVGLGYLDFAPAWMKEWFAACRTRVGLSHPAPGAESTASGEKRG
jgi:serine/threonine protein kinase/tetratricopeptide (TPR) repeat protein